MQKKYRYNKNEFVDIICRNCNLCKNIGNPSFCYTVVYKKHKRKFIQKIFPKLLMLKKEEDFSGVMLHTYDQNKLQLAFEQIFVENNLIKYKNVFKYVNAFKTQLNNDLTMITKMFKLHKKKKNNYIVKAYPTFFTNNREGLQEEIHEILNNGNNINK